MLKLVQTPTFMSIGTMVIELREFNYEKKKKKKKKNTMDKMQKVIIWPKSGNLMKQVNEKFFELKRDIYRDCRKSTGNKLG